MKAYVPLIIAIVVFVGSFAVFADRFVQIGATSSFDETLKLAALTVNFLAAMYCVYFGYTRLRGWIKRKIGAAQKRSETDI